MFYAAKRSYGQQVYCKNSGQRDSIITVGIYECPDGIAAQIITELPLLGYLVFGALKNDLAVISWMLWPPTWPSVRGQKCLYLQRLLKHWEQL